MTYTGDRRLKGTYTLQACEGAPGRSVNFHVVTRDGYKLFFTAASTSAKAEWVRSIQAGITTAASKADRRRRTIKDPLAAAEPASEGGLLSAPYCVLEALTSPPVC